MRYEFVTSEPPKLRFGISAGRIDVETADVSETIVDVEAIRGELDDLKVEQHGRDIVIEARAKTKLRLRPRVPDHDHAPRTARTWIVNVASADFRSTGRLGALEVEHRLRATSWPRMSSTM